MKVLQINAVYGFKSTGLIVSDIASMLEKNGHEAYVAYQRAIHTPKKAYLIGNILDWKWHALHTRIFGKQGYASKKATKKFISYIDEIKPDIVHLHNLHSNYINLNMLCGFLADKKIPTVITLHDCWYFTGKCSHYVEVGCDRWQNACGNCPNLNTEVKSLWLDNTEKVLKDKTSHLNEIENLTLIACSNWMKKEAEKSLLSPKRIEVILNGVDTDVFTPHDTDFRKKYNLENKYLIMGMADKWLKKSNEEAFSAIVKDNHDAGIVIVGCSEEQKKLCEKYENVLALGYIKNRRDLSDIYASSDVFVNLTHADTLPTVNMESICSGTPVITYDCCGSPELIKDGVTGYIVPENDVCALVDAIEKLKETPLNFDVAHEQKIFDKNSCYNEYLKIYNDVLKRD